MASPEMIDGTSKIIAALNARQPLIDPDRHEAIRLFNGFYEGIPGLVIDLFASTILIIDHIKPPYLPSSFLDEIHKRKPAVRIFFGDTDHQAKVCLNQLGLCLSSPAAILFPRSFSCSLVNRATLPISFKYSLI